MSLTLEDLRRAIPRKREQVDVPEFGEGATLWVYALTAGEMNAVNASMMNKSWEGIDKEKAKFRTERIVCAAIRDENGQRILSDNDIDVLSGWPLDLFDRVWAVANGLNGNGIGKNAKKNLDETDEE